MPVKFFPHKPIELLEKFITKDDGSPLQGEIDIYRKLHTELAESIIDWYVWHDLKLPKHSDVFNEYHKESCQIDFLILSTDGIVVLEVKGGSISLKDSNFYYGKKFNERMNQNPFTQAEGYKYTLKDKILNNLGKCLITFGVALPHVDYPIEAKIFDENILWSKYRSQLYNNSIEAFITSVFEHNKNQHKKHGRRYPALNGKEIEAIIRTLSPIVIDKSKYEARNTLEWLSVSNLEILEGLYKNKRIMIEGPPGCGKTTIAKAFIDNQIGKTGIYLCWNNFLMHYTKMVLAVREVPGNIEVTTLTRFILQLAPDIKATDIFSLTELEFYELVKRILNTLEEESILPTYDYMVIDEGQDIFDRGLDLLINKLCGYNKHGLENGTSLILYDIDQSYSVTGRNVLEISDLFSEYFSHYKLNEIKRSAQYPDIKQLAGRVFNDPEILLHYETTLLKNVTISKHKNLEAVKKYIVANFLNQMRDADSSLRGGECILLAESVLLKDTFKDEPGFKYWMTIKDVEELNESNVTDNSNKLRYTSVLKFKGLEKENVFLVVTTPCDQNKYELYVGVTRAISNLEILIVD